MNINYYDAANTIDDRLRADNNVNDARKCNEYIFMASKNNARDETIETSPCAKSIKNNNFFSFMICSYVLES